MSRAIDERLLPQPGEDHERPLGGFGWLLAAACIFNFFVFPCLRAVEGGSRGTLFVGASAVGLFPAQLGALTLWLVWGPGSFLRRLAVHWIAALALFAAWALGIAVAIGGDGPARELPSIWGAVCCSLPIVSLAAQLPLWPLRTHLGWRVDRLREEASADPRLDRSLALPSPPDATRQPLAIRDILTGTVVTAVALAGIRAVAALTDARQAGGQVDPGFWLGWGLAVLIIAAVSLLGFLPALCLLLRGDEPAPRVALWLAYVAVVALVTIVVVAGLVGAGPNAEPFVGLFCLLASFALALVVPLLLARSLGWRLVLPGDPPPAPLAKVATSTQPCDTRAEGEAP
jgi:hypothetical protein